MGEKSENTEAILQRRDVALLLRQLYFEATWILPERKAVATPLVGAVRIETLCPDGDAGRCVYYVFSLRPLSNGLVGAIRRLLKLMHYDVEDGEMVFSVANAMITAYNSTCRELVTPAKLIYELAAKAGLKIEAREHDDGLRRTDYLIEGVGKVSKMEYESSWCLIADRMIKPGPAVKWLI